VVDAFLFRIVWWAAERWPLFLEKFLFATAVLAVSVFRKTE